jgi:hypothetical protein
MQTGFAVGIEAGHPTMSALARDPHRLGDVGDRLPIVANPLNEQTTAMKRETSVTVRHRRPPGL